MSGFLAWLLGNADREPFSRTDVCALDRAKHEAARCSRWTSADEIRSCLRDLWTPPKPAPELPRTVFQEMPPRFSPGGVREKSTDEWAFAMTSEFKKAVKHADKNMRARILQAITGICDDPTASHGDTVKPLTGGMRGLWRCRIGDHRLVYKPDRARRQVALLHFSARGSVY